MEIVPILSLWLPILLSAVFAFLASSVIHMMLKYHASDFSGLPKEDEVMDALRKFNIPPGEYVIPRAGSMEAMKSPGYIEKTKKGPVAFMTVMESGVQGMGKSLALWFVYCVVVGILTAYITGRTMGPGSDYLKVFQIAGATAFCGYSLALLQNSIWYKRKWSSTAKSMFDGLIYASLTGGTFGWLWPVV